MAAEQKKEKKKIIHKLRHKYRLIMYNDLTFEEVWHFRLSRLNVLSLLGTFVIAMVIIVSLLIMYTPVRELIPGYPDSRLRRTMLLNSLKVDSLERQLKLRDQYLSNIQDVISGKEPVSDLGKRKDTTHHYKNLSFGKSPQDSVLRKQVEEEEKYNFSSSKEPVTNGGISNLLFFPPLKGLVTNSANISEDHYGTDIVASPNEAVKSVLDGTVILSTWTLETGYVIEIQHANNLLSVYKHNAELLKRSGDKVKAGEPIAIVGNSGELTTGPHLHFEMWYNGRPLNPEDYIVF
jgi:murein DD-endopeptidase MepM/ murein hydrolase activator NlpD